MTHVYVVEPDDYPEDVNIIGIFAKKEDADIAAAEQEEADTYGRKYTVTEWPLQ